MCMEITLNSAHKSNIKMHKFLALRLTFFQEACSAIHTNCVISARDNGASIFSGAAS